MKVAGIEKALSKLSGHATKAQEVLAAILDRDAPPEPVEETMQRSKPEFAKVPTSDHRPDLSEQLGNGFFDSHTGLPHVAMENFPLPKDEDQSADADLYA
ncbi:MAG: hypothetical protein MUF63_02890 [Rhodobacteraceae bacterium]|nr:hypothetical protein [Paracoccaceae bacterium]